MLKSLLSKAVFLLFLFFPSFNFSLEDSFQLELCERLYEENLLKEAIHEYKRILFFEKDEGRKRDLLLKLAIIYREYGDYKSSLKYIKDFLDLTEDEELKNRGYLELGLTYTYMTNLGMAEYQFMKVKSFSTNIMRKKEATFYLILTHSLEYNWKGVKENFEEFVLLLDDEVKEKKKELIDEIRFLINRIEHFKPKSPEVARWISFFIWGGGQLYSGDFSGAFNAFILNGLIAYLLFNTIITSDYLDAIFIGLTFLERYYSGNIYHAEQSAIKYNERQNEKFREELFTKMKSLSQ